MKLHFMTPWIRTMGVGALAGLGCIMAPPYLLPGGIRRTYEAPLFPALRTAWENLAFLPTMLLLFILGMGLGAALPKSWRSVGISPVLLLPVAAILEMFADPTSHNLWPIEFVFYGFVGLASLAGALAGSLLKRRVPDC
jgi:hypothetical protein